VQGKKDVTGLLNDAGCRTAALTSRASGAQYSSINDQPTIARDNVLGLHTNPPIQESINPFCSAVFAIGREEVSQSSDEITVNCVPLV